MATPRKTRSAGPAEDIDLDHPAGGAEADAHLMGVHPPTRLEKEVRPFSLPSLGVDVLFEITNR
jgi:hypothetical protein